MVPPLTAIFWHVLITTTCRPASLFEPRDCQPSICSFLRLSARRKATVNSEFTKEERKQKEACEMCNFHSARLMGKERRRQGGERRGGEEGQGEVESLWVRKKQKISVFIGSCLFNYVLLLHLFHLNLTLPLFFFSLRSSASFTPSSLLLSELVQS